MSIADETLEELRAKKDDLTETDLVALDQDEREGARHLAAQIRQERAQASASAALEEKDPRLDKGPVRWEDSEGAVPFVDTPTDAPEIDPESQRKNEHTVLAEDRFDGEGKRVILGGK